MLHQTPQAWTWQNKEPYGFYNVPNGAVYYDWATGRGHENLLRILGTKDEQHIARIIQCDGYSAYLTMTLTIYKLRMDLFRD